MQQDRFYRVLPHLYSRAPSSRDRDSGIIIRRHSHIVVRLSLIAWPIVKCFLHFTIGQAMRDNRTTMREWRLIFNTSI